MRFVKISTKLATNKQNTQENDLLNLIKGNNKLKELVKVHGWQNWLRKHQNLSLALVRLQQPTALEQKQSNL